MENTSEVTKALLDRKDVLNAIDFEISHRESMLSRHGFSTWGLLAATCALLWASITEALTASHNWTNVLLVQLAGWWMLGFVSSPWTKALGFCNLRATTARTLKQLILRFGVDEENIIYHALHSTMMLGIAIYLGFKGFVLLSVSASAFSVCTLLTWGFCFMVLRFKLPLRLPVQATEAKSKSKYSGVLARLLALALALVPVDAVRSVWPIGTADTRLGLLLAALSSIWVLSLLIIRPPATAFSLRELRSELAFGEIEAEEARTKSLYILRGTPDDYYLTSKADEAAEELKQSSRLYKTLSDQMQQVIPLAEKLKAANCSEPVRHAVSREFRTLFNSTRTNMSAVDKHMTRAADLHIRVQTRIETAELFLNLSPEIGKAVLQRLDALVQEVEASRKAFAKAVDAETFKPAFDFLCSVQRDLKLPRNQTPYQLIRACFSD